ncbi:MAG: CBS domain-containing protein [Candidatus Sericytochromatia bacterium]
MKQREPVSHIMTQQLQVVSPQQTLHDAEVIFESHRFRHLPVVEGSRLVGILSRTDMMRLRYGTRQANAPELQGLLASRTVSSAMTPAPRTITADTEIREAAEILLESSFSALPVLNRDELVGILSSRDLIRYLLEQY